MMSDRLLLDTMLGTLATYLRMCGYDTAYTLDEGVEDDDAVLALAQEQGRTLLTRDRELAGRANDAILLESRDVTGQLEELAEHGLALSLSADPARCGVCNDSLERVEAGAQTPDYAPDPEECAVWQCPACGQHFWKGSHWDDVAATLADLQ